MKIILWALGGLALAVAGFAVFVRVAPSDPARWHVDPLSVARPGFPGHFLMRPENGDEDGPVLAVPPREALDAFDEVAMAAPRTRRLAGSVESGRITYVQRSALWGFPDYLTVRALPAEAGSQLAIFSRLRFGHDDMGVNAARVRDWVERTQAALGAS